jgi:hypothetical protein
MTYRARQRSASPSGVASSSVQEQLEPSILLNKEPAIAVRQLRPVLYSALQVDQLLQKRRILGLKAGSST